VRFDRPDIVKQPPLAARQLAEQMGVAASIPNQRILIGALGLHDSTRNEKIALQTGAPNKWWPGLCLAIA
jgi:hypothetical protein